MPAAPPFGSATDLEDVVPPARWWVLFEGDLLDHSMGSPASLGDGPLGTPPDAGVVASMMPEKHGKFRASGGAYRLPEPTA